MGEARIRAEQQYFEHQYGKPSSTAVSVDVGVSVDETGNLQAFVRSNSQQTSQQAINGYDKSGPSRFAQDSKQASRSGLVR